MKPRDTDPADPADPASTPAPSPTAPSPAPDVSLRLVPPTDDDADDVDDVEGVDDGEAEAAADADATEQQILERVTSHIQLARELGIEPLTIDERATAMLDAACDGWRFDRRCRDGDRVLPAPHPMCLRAQYHHDVLLLEHGLLDHEGPTHER